VTGTAEQDLEALTGAMTAATAQTWLPQLKLAVDKASHGNGQSASPDEAIRRALDKALSFVPADWELLCLRGTSLAGQSDFDAALRDFDAAIKAAPSSPKPYAGRSYLYTRLGDWAAALADLDRAAALSGEGAGSSLDRGLVLLSLGRAAEARAEFARHPNDPEARYQLGRALMAEGKTDEAQTEIRAAIAGTGSGSSRRRSYELMETAAAALGHIAKSGKAASAPGEIYMSDAKKKAAKDGKGCLWLLGVGIDRPYEVTLNTLMALKRCDAVYTQADTREVRELLEAVFPGAHTIATGGGKGANPQETVWKTVKAELDKGSQTGYVTYGHPMLFGEGNMMAKRCKDAGYAYRVMTAPSSIDGILTMLQEDLDLCERGFTVQNARSLTEPGAAVDASKGAIILGVNRVMEENKFGAFCDRLEAAFPKEHILYALKCGDGYRDETRLKLTVAEFRRKERELDPALTLFVPEIKTGRAESAPRGKKAR